MHTKEPAEALKLDQLEEAYEVVGEITGRTDARTFLGKRRTDGSDVLIVVAQTPPGDEGNALSHLAADANLLASSGQRNLLSRNLLSIVESQWLGTDAFAM